MVSGPNSKAILCTSGQPTECGFEFQWAKSFGEGSHGVHGEEGARTKPQRHEGEEERGFSEFQKRVFPFGRVRVWCEPPRLQRCLRPPSLSVRFSSLLCVLRGLCVWLSLRIRHLGVFRLRGMGFRSPSVWWGLGGRALWVPALPGVSRLGARIRTFSSSVPTLE